MRVVSDGAGTPSRLDAEAQRASFARLVLVLRSTEPDLRSTRPRKSITIEPTASRRGDRRRNRSTRRDGPVANVRMVANEVEAFIAGQLNESQQAQLAQQVSEIVAASPLVPNEATTYLERVVRHLGGQAQLLDWLAQFPGEPALVAATEQLVDLLG